MVFTRAVFFRGAGLVPGQAQGRTAT